MTKDAPDQGNLFEVTQDYLAIGHFGQNAQATFSRLFHKLYSSAPREQRLSVAQLLCRQRGVPLDVLKLLCCDDSEVASPILARSPLLGLDDLTMQILQGTMKDRQAISQRMDLSSVIASQLLSFGEEPVARSMLGNEQCMRDLPAGLKERIRRLAGVKIEETGQRAMTQDKTGLDALVSSMEEEWVAHYHPEKMPAKAASPKDQDALFSTAMTDARTDRDAGMASPGFSDDTLVEDTTALEDMPLDRTDALPPRRAQEEPLIDAEDLALMQRLKNADWENLDDAALEALAEQLAEEELGVVEATMADVRQEMDTLDASLGQDGLRADEAPESSLSRLDIDAAPPRNTPAPETMTDTETTDADEWVAVDDHASPVAAQPHDAQTPPTRDEEELGPNSFRIGALDPGAAPIPPLERHEGPHRVATITYVGYSPVEDEEDPRTSAEMIANARSQAEQIEDRGKRIEAELALPDQDPVTHVTQTEPAMQAAPQAASGASTNNAQPKADKPVVHAASSTEEDLAAAGCELTFALKRPLDPTEAAVLAERVTASIEAAGKLARASTEAPKPLITLSVRKHGVGSAAGTDEQKAPAAQASAPSVMVPRVKLTSATEEDWYKALARLNSDFDPSSAEAATTGFVESLARHPAPIASPAPVAEEQDNAPAPDAAPQAPSQEASQEASFAAQADRELSEPFEPIVDAEPSKEDSAEITPPRVSVPFDGIPLQSREGAETREPQAAATIAPAPEVKAHASMGFMPDPISFAGLDLVEAEPDMPSATDFLLAQHNRMAPSIELVEPVELDFLEQGKRYSVDEMLLTPMQVITEQLSAERARLSAENTTPETHGESEQITLSVLRADAANSLEDNRNQDLTDLPEMADHRLVDNEEYRQLRAEDTEQAVQKQEETADSAAPSEEAPQGWHDHRSLSEVLDTGSALNGFADRFYGYDEETRLNILQEIMAETLVDQAQLNANLKTRTMLDDKTAQMLVMARFGNDRIHLAEMLHDISGHRRLDLTRLLQDKGGEALVVYLYDIGLDEGCTLSMVLHGPDAIAHSYMKVAQLMTLYNQLYPAASARIVTQLFGSPSLNKAKAQHTPIHHDGAETAAPRLRNNDLADRAQQATSSAYSLDRRQSSNEG